MTLIIMLILAGISLSGLIGGKGLFKRTEDASNRYNEKKAREVLETVLLTDGQFEKNINPEYNEEEFLNKLIKEEIPGSDVRGDVAIIGGEYAYDLDRSVPKIGIRGNNGYLGNPKDLVWPDLDVKVNLADDKKDATIKIEASEKKNGINKIEIWLLGEMIKEYTYDPSKPEVTENYTATQNGKYTIKAYGELMDSKTVEVDGIVASVKFDPNGDDTWKKSHSTTVTIEEKVDKVVSAKYVWINSVTTPDNSKFLEDQTFKSRDTITKNGDTGTYYLWTKLETQSGEILKWRSEGFNFDNTEPKINSFTSTPVDYSSFKLNVTAIDNQSGIAEYEFFVNNISKGKIPLDGIKTSNSQEITVTNANYGNNNCYVIVTDKLGHTTRQDITAKTLMDTTGPTITSFIATPNSETAITLSATAQDTGSGIVKFVFSVGSKTQEVPCTATTSSVTKSVTITGLSTGSGQSCKVIVYDAKNNSSETTTSGRTLLHTWDVYNAEVTGTELKRFLDTSVNEFSVEHEVSRGERNWQVVTYTSEPRFQKDPPVTTNPPDYNCYGTNAGTKHNPGTGSSAWAYSGGYPVYVGGYEYIRSSYTCHGLATRCSEGCPSLRKKQLLCKVHLHLPRTPFCD